MVRTVPRALPGAGPDAGAAAGIRVMLPARPMRENPGLKTFRCDMRRRRPRGATALRRGFAGLLVPVAAALLALFSFQASGESNARQFAAHALALRAAGAAGEQKAAGVLAALPGAGSGEAEALAALWRPFFENAIVKLGRVNAPGPVALYYNPLLDIAVLTFWRVREGRHVVTTIRALPGERLGAPGSAPAEQPAWMAAADPVDALGRITAARLDAFRRAHPAEARSGARDAATFAAAADDMRAAMPRLVWLLAARAQWLTEGHAWLRRTLADIDAALRARDAAGLAQAAPETDASTAAALARLPEGFAARLALDAVLPLPERNELVVASLPDDGGVFLLATCRRQDGNCGLRRFMLLSLPAG